MPTRNVHPRKPVTGNIHASKILTVLRKDWFVKFSALGTPGKVVWFNFGLARRQGFDVPSSNRMTPRFHRQLITALSYRALQPQSSVRSVTPTSKLSCARNAGGRALVTRVLDTYFEGVITGTERDKKIAEIEREKQVFSDLLTREEPTRQIDVETLAQQFKVFRQFDLLSRDQKRKLLNTITPRIVVANYQVEGMSCAIGGSPMAMVYDKDERIFLPLGPNLKAA